MKNRLFDLFIYFWVLPYVFVISYFRLRITSGLFPLLLFCLLLLVAPFLIVFSIKRSKYINEKCLLWRIIPCVLCVCIKFLIETLVLTYFNISVNGMDFFLLFAITFAEVLVIVVLLSAFAFWNK